MVTAAPHFLLRTETHSDPHGGRWRFSLRRETGRLVLEAADIEPGLAGPRLELLAAVRGLESIEVPSRVTLITPSSYVRRGIDYGLDSWRQNEWTWEWFGQMVPVKNRDLWQRIDRALRFHQVRCRRWRVDGPHAARSPSMAIGRTFAAAPASCLPAAPNEKLASAFCHGAARQRGSGDAMRKWQRRTLRGRRWLAEQVDAWRLRLEQLGMGLLPQPWLE